MKIKDYIENIKLELTGGILNLEIPDSTIEKVVYKSLKELQRFIDETRLITVPFASCIDLSGSKVSSVSRVFRTEGFNGDTTCGDGRKPSTVIDPMYAQTWMAFTNGGTMYNLQDYLLNYMSYNTLLQMRNTTSTDLAFKQDRYEQKLYVNCATDTPQSITIEYVPVFENVDEVKSDYWIDILLKLSIAQTKLILGRIRSRYKQSSALWEQDGDTLLSEANEELANLRDMLTTNSQIIYPID